MVSQPCTGACASTARKQLGNSVSEVNDAKPWDKRKQDKTDLCDDDANRLDIGSFSRAGGDPGPRAANYSLGGESLPHARRIHDRRNRRKQGFVDVRAAPRNRVIIRSCCTVFSSGKPDKHFRGYRVPHHLNNAKCIHG